MLLIEDNETNQKLVARYLTAKGFRVATASNTKQADVQFAAERPSLVLVDVSLPGEDGLSWVRRNRQSAQEIPFFAFTAHALPADRDRAIEAGCQGLVLKPVNLSVLFELAQKYAGIPDP